MSIKAVLFDLGDTLIFRAHVPDPAVLFTTMARQVQPLLDDWAVVLSADLPALLSETYLAVVEAQPGRRARGREVDGAFILRGAFATHGVEVSAEQASALWRASAIDHAAWGSQTYPDTIDTLRRLRSLDMPVALVSNNTYPAAAERMRLPSVGITEYLLPIIVTSADLMRVKPDPALFLRALDQLGIDAADAVFVGDEVDADVRGAKALGMTAVWKLNGRHEVDVPPEADYAIHDLWELFTLGLLPGGFEAALPQDSLMPHEDANADRY